MRKEIEGFSHDVEANVFRERCLYYFANSIPKEPLHYSPVDKIRFHPLEDPGLLLAGRDDQVL